MSVGNNNHDIFGTQEEFLNAHFVGYNHEAAVSNLFAVGYSFSKPCFYCTNHSWSKIPIRLNIS